MIWDNFESKHAMIDRNEFKLTARGESAAADFKEINRGLDQLLLQSKREHYGIAIYHSQVSARINWMHQFIGLGRHWIKRFSWHEYKEDARSSLRTAWIKLIEDNGFQFLFLSPEQLLENRIAKENIKVIILPEVWSLSEQEVTLLSQFVEEGGLLIADHFTGLYDGVGKRNDKGALDELFGIDQGLVLGDTRYSKNSFTNREIVLGADFSELVKKGTALKDLDTRENGAQPVSVKDEAAKFYCGEINDAALIERKVEKGMAVFLNVDVSSYGWLRISKEKEAQLHRERLRSIIGKYLKTKVQPYAEVLDEKTKQRQQGVEVGLWHVSENKKVLGLWRNFQVNKDGIGGEHFVDNSIFESEENVEVVLQEKCFVSNLRTGEELGFVASFQAKISPWEPLLFSVRKVKEEGFKVFHAEAIEAGSLLNVVIKTGEKNELNAFFVELFDPQGVGYWYYKKDVSGESNILRCAFPMALNDKKGKWRVVLTDVYTKIKTERSFELK